MNDSWMFLVGVILAFLGVAGLLTGMTALGSYVPGYRDRPGHFVPTGDPVYLKYKGRGLAIVMTVTAAVLLAMFFFSRPSRGTIPSQIANIVSIIACIVGAIFALALMSSSDSRD